MVSIIFYINEILKPPFNVSIYKINILLAYVKGHSFVIRSLINKHLDLLRKTEVILLWQWFRKFYLSKQLICNPLIHMSVRSWLYLLQAWHGKSIY